MNNSSSRDRGPDREDSCTRAIRPVGKGGALHMYRYRICLQSCHEQQYPYKRVFYK